MHDKLDNKALIKRLKKHLSLMDDHLIHIMELVDSLSARESFKSIKDKQENASQPNLGLTTGG